MKIAMIGTGWVAQQHLRVLANEPDIGIVGHVSPTFAHATTAAQRWGGRAYINHVDLLDHEEVDATWICVIPGAHGTLEHDLIAHRIPFFVEKPLATDRRTAEQIAAQVADSGVIAGVGYHWRALDTLPEVLHVIAENPPRMVLGAWHGTTPPSPWWGRHALSGGQIVEQATHLFDLARLLVGEADVLSASASRYERPAYPDADIANVSVALLRYQSGATGIFTATCLLDRAETVHLQLVCEGLLITITPRSVTYDTNALRRKVRTHKDPFVVEDRAFLQAVRERNPHHLISSYADALHTHQLCCDVLDRSGFIAVQQDNV